MWFWMAPTPYVTRRCIQLLKKDFSSHMFHLYIPISHFYFYANTNLMGAYVLLTSSYSLATSGSDSFPTSYLLTAVSFLLDFSLNLVLTINNCWSELGYALEFSNATPPLDGDENMDDHVMGESIRWLPCPLSIHFNLSKARICYLLFVCIGKLNQLLTSFINISYAKSPYCTTSIFPVRFQFYVEVAH